MPGVVDLWSYGETGYHSLAAAVVKERYKREAMASAFRILGEGQLSLTKFLLVTDRAGRPPRLPRHARARPGAHAPRDRPLRLLEPLDGHARLHGPDGQRGLEGRLARPGRPGARAAPRVPPGRRRRRPRSRDVRVFCGGCLVVGGPSCGRGPGAAAAPRRAPGFRRVAARSSLTDEPARAAASPMNFLWTTFTRFEPAADIHAAATRVVRHHVVHEPPVLIDARTKPSYPERGLVRPRDRRPGHAALEGVLPRRRASRWATRSGPTSTGRRRRRVRVRCARRGRRLDSFLGRSKWDRALGRGSWSRCACVSPGRRSPAFSSGSTTGRPGRSPR